MVSITDDTGVVRYLGNNEQPGGLVKAWPTFGDTEDQKVLSRAELLSQAEEVDLFNDPSLPYVHDQDGIGQCNADATAAMAEFLRARQGLTFIETSAADLYDRINGGYDGGSLLEDAMHEMTTRGIGTSATAGKLWRRGMRGASDEERSRIKVKELWTCPTFEHFGTACLKGYAGVVGIWWYSGYRVGSDGWLEARTSGSRGGHALMSFKLVRRGTQLGLATQNSWTMQWGVRGLCVLPEECFRMPGIGGWWVGRQMTDEGGVVPPLAA